MAATRYRFEPTELHSQITDAFAWCQYSRFLKQDNESKKAASLGLVGAVVDELFLSVPEDQVRHYWEVLAEQVEDLVGLQQQLAMAGEVEGPRRRIGNVVVNVGEILTIHRPMQREYWETLPAAELCRIAFSAPYERIREYIESSLNGMHTLAGKTFNPYAFVSIEPVFVRNRAILFNLASIDLVVGGDVRHQYYKQHFPTGRYKADM